MHQISASIKFVSYLRVSTSKQGISGLGLQSQRDIVASYAFTKGVVISEYVEIESGRNNDRTQLQLALNHCKRANATLVIAKLDRLSRNAAFLINLQDSKTKFVCCDMPEANEMMIGIMAILAQHERKIISARTKAALDVLKERGVKLGANTHKIKKLGMSQGDKVRDASIAARKRNSNEFKLAWREKIIEYRSAKMTFDAIAIRLTNDGMVTPRGNSKWNGTQVRRLLGL